MEKAARLNGRLVRDRKGRTTYPALEVRGAELLSSLPLPLTPYCFVYLDAPYQHLVGDKSLGSAHVQRTLDYLEDCTSPTPSPEFPISPRISYWPPPQPQRLRNRVDENSVRRSTTICEIYRQLCIQNSVLAMLQSILSIPLGSAIAAPGQKNRAVIFVSMLECKSFKPLTVCLAVR